MDSKRPTGPGCEPVELRKCASEVVNRNITEIFNKLNDQVKVPK